MLHYKIVHIIYFYNIDEKYYESNIVLSMLFTVIFEHIWQNASMGRLGMWIRSARSAALQYLIQIILQSIMSQELIILCNME